MRIVVTGAAGFIGSHLAERLALAGHDVRGVDGLTPFYDVAMKRQNARRLTSHGAEMHTLDLATDSLDAVLDGADAVVHLAAQPGLSGGTSREDFVRNNVIATQRLLDALTAQGEEAAFVYASSSSVYGAEATGTEDGDLSPVSDYGRTKLEAERRVRRETESAPWDACIVRLFSVYGPRERPDKLLPKAIRCTLLGDSFPLYAGSEHHRRSFTYVGDAVTGFEKVLARFDRCAGETINLGTPTSVTTLQALETVATVTGAPTCIRRAPAREGDQRRTRAQVDKARRLLDFVPTTSLRDGIAAEVTWMRRRLSADASSRRL